MISRLLLAVLPLRAAAYYIPRSIGDSSSQSLQIRQQNAAGVNNLLVFGNSYSAVGFNPTGAAPSAQNPIGNPAWPGNNLSGGENWVTYLTGTYNRSTTYTYDFAYNCATVDEHLVAPCSADVTSIAQQVEEFRADFVDNGAARTHGFDGANTLAAIWIGINDAHRSWEKTNATEIMAAVVDRYFELVGELAGMGLKTIVLLGIPAIERTPQILNEPAASQALELSTYRTFNADLEEKFRDDAYPGVKLIRVDTVPIFNEILDHPEKLQAPNATCVGKDSGCLWSDAFHPSPKMHRVIAQRIAEILSPAVPWFFQTP